MGAFHVMIKPAGALCNLRCDYCFFTHKTELLQSNAVMSEKVLETFIRDYIACQADDVIVFSWQGGEPTLAGPDFFRTALALQRRYCPPGKQIENDLQTNGMLLDDEWFRFLKENRFLVGLSVDGPPYLHDQYRKQASGAPTSGKVEACAAQLKEHRIPFNTLTTVHHDNARYPLEVYRYLRDVIGSEHIQFLPVVETLGFEREPPGFWPLDKLDVPEKLDHLVTPWSVRPLEYGRFLTAVFREWLDRDLGKHYIYLFESLLSVRAGFRSIQCTEAASCGNALALDQDGSLYCCDRFCYPAYRLGNILEQSLTELERDIQLQVFRRFKGSLPQECKSCEFLSSCYGGCPKNRFALTASGQPGLNYLCPGWKLFLKETAPALDALAAALKTSVAQKC